MGHQQPWIRWLRKLPVWTSGIVGLATAIIGFIGLLQGNYLLGATILVILALAALFCACLYVAFARRPPKIPEAKKGVYIYELKHRSWAFVGVGFILGLWFVFALLLFEPSHKIIDKMFPRTPTSTMTLTPPDILTPTPTPAVTRSTRVAILTFHETYVTAMNDQQGWDWELWAKRDTVKDWEKFFLLYLDNGKVALKTDHGKFVSATRDDGCCNWILKAETPHRGESEEFSLINAGDGKIAFKTYQGTYVSATSAEQCWRVRAETRKPGDWEKFTLIPQD